MAKRKDETIRFWSKVKKTDTCWLWMGSKVNGYGTFWFDNKYVRAHRYSYQTLVGPVPAGLQLDHLCRVLSCVNPDHLEPVTGKVNMLRGEGIQAQNARKTHCKHGHEFTPENTYYERRGRYCIACHRINNRKYMRKYYHRKATVWERGATTK